MILRTDTQGRKEQRYCIVICSVHSRGGRALKGVVFVAVRRDRIHMHERNKRVRAAVLCATCLPVGQRNNLSDQLQLLLYSASTLQNFMR